jgi:Leucine-rich repeat (LRR) protein
MSPWRLRFEVMGDERALLLFERDLEALPVDLADYPALEVLDLNRNPRLGRLPDLTGLTRLRYLYAEALGLTELPALPASLEYLNVAHNRLERLAALELARLRELRVGGNPIAQLNGDAFARTPSLRLLSLRSCRLERLPKLAGLAELRDLDLRANALRDVPEAVAALPRLERIDLRWNPMAAIPATLERLARRGGVLWHPTA